MNCNYLIKLVISQLTNCWQFKLLRNSSKSIKCIWIGNYQRVVVIISKSVNSWSLIRNKLYEIYFIKRKQNAQLLTSNQLS